MLIGRPVRASESERTLGELITTELQLAAYSDVLAPGAAADIIDEIWSAAENAHAAAVPRAHRHGGTTSEDLEVAPEEWLYLPFPPPSGYVVNRVDLTGSESSADEICAKVVETAKLRLLVLPGGTCTPADLERCVFNAAIRSGKPAMAAYFYSAPPPMVAVDAVPSTAAGGKAMTAAQATPDWLVPLWHWIDLLRNATEQHAAILQDLFDLCAEGKMMTMALTSVDSLLTVLERECKISAPTSVLDKIGDAFGRAYSPDEYAFDIKDFHGKLTALKDAAKESYVTNPTFPLLSTFAVACGTMKTLGENPEFLAAYEKFDKERGRYPVTEQALQHTLAFYALCRGHAPDGDDFADAVAKAVKGSPDRTPVFLEILNVIKLASDNAISPVTATVGNAPGPLTLLVAAGRIDILRKLRTPSTAAISVESYVAWAAKLAGVPPDALSTAATAVSGRNAQLFQARIEAANLAADGMHSGPRFLKIVSFLDIIVFVSAAYTTVLDIRKGAVLDATVDVVSGVGAGMGFVGAVAGQIKYAALLRGTVAKEAGKALADLTVKNVTGLMGKLAKWIAVAGLVAGSLQIVQGIRDKDSVEKWQGTGTILVSMQPFLDIFFSKYAAQIGARVTVLLIEVVAEESALAIGGGLAAVLGGLGTVVGGVGAIILLVCIVYKNREAIAAFLTRAATPGPARACYAYLEAVASSKVFSVGAQAVRTAHAAARAALEHAYFVNFLPSDAVRKELKKAGLSDDDLRVVSELATLTADTMAGMSMAH